MKEQSIQNNTTSALNAGLFTLALRLVVGWTYFSAFWRRMVLEDKLDPEAAGYIGEKFNHFLPNALGIKPMIEYLVSNPEMLWWAMLAFTLIEAVVGFFFMLGLFTRFMSLSVLGLAMGILLGSGWLGTTCLDEWQIGVLGVAGGFAMFWSGGGRYSLDAVLMPKLPKKIRNWKWLPLVTSGDLPLSEKKVNRIILPLSLAILFLCLFTNQVFHNGVWGKLHNKSVKPLVELTEGKLANDELEFTVFRVEGADVYGSFLIGIDLVDENGNNIVSIDGKGLSSFPMNNIKNHYVAKVKPGKHSMIIPLGAKADIKIQDAAIAGLTAGNYKVVLTDISGATWTLPVVK